MSFPIVICASVAMAFPNGKRHLFKGRKSYKKSYKDALMTGL